MTGRTTPRQFHEAHGVDTWWDAYGIEANWRGWLLGHFTGVGT